MSLKSWIFKEKQTLSNDFDDLVAQCDSAFYVRQAEMEAEINAYFAERHDSLLNRLDSYPASLSTHFTRSFLALYQSDKLLDTAPSVAVNSIDMSLEGHTEQREKIINHASMFFEENFTGFLSSLNDLLVNISRQMSLPAETVTGDNFIGFLSTTTTYFDSLNDPARSLQFIFDEMERMGRHTDPPYLTNVYWRLVYNFNEFMGVDHHKKTKVNFGQAYTKNPSHETAKALLKGTPFDDLMFTEITVRIDDEKRFAHTSIFASSGHGKSQLLQNMILHDLGRTLKDRENGVGLVIMDSQGDMINRLKKLFIFDPDFEGRLGDKLLIIDPEDVAYTPQFNIFALHTDVDPQSLTAAEREQAFNATIDNFEFLMNSLFSSEMTVQQSLLFRYLSELMTHIPDANILTLKDIVETPENFIDAIDQCQPLTRDFLRRKLIDGKIHSKTAEAMITRIHIAMQNPTFARMFGATQNRLNLTKFLNEGGILLINTNKSFLSPTASSLFGRFILANLFRVAIDRMKIPQAERRPTFVYVDEAAEYLHDDTIAKLLQQARKYKIGMILAFQELAQTKSIQSAISNTAIKFAGRLDAGEASKMAKNMSTSTEHIMGLQNLTFAMYASGITPKAANFNVEYVNFEKDWKLMNAAAYKKLLNRSRALLAGVPQSLTQPSDITQDSTPQIVPLDEIPDRLENADWGDDDNDSGYKPF